MKNKIFLLLVLIFSKSISGHTQSFPYKDPGLQVESRVQDLLSRMTNEEKFWQLFMIPGDLGDDSTNYRHGLFGFQVNTTQQQANTAGQLLHYAAGQGASQTREKINSIQRYFIEHTRLGIPIIAFDEALHGLVREGATAFPASIALAASWDTALMTRVATAIAQETRARGIRDILSPVVNLATDSRWGRVEETYGEDPFLTTVMGLSYVRAFERMGIVTTPKHFVVNHGDGGRDSYPIHANERLLEETYFLPFKALVQQGGARSIMTAYNSLDGSPCSANDWLLNQKLKKEWGFRGFVISDAGATGGANVLHFTAADYAEAGRKSIENGQDVIFQTSYDHHSLFEKYFLDGSIRKGALDSAVARVLRVKFELGIFDHPYAQPGDAGEWSLIEHRQLSRLAAERSLVLLKNDKQLLPLSNKIRKMALIGTDAAEARLGGYSGPGNDKVSLLQALRNNKDRSMEIGYAPGPGRSITSWKFIDPTYFSTSSNGKKIPGLRGEYFNNISLTGEPALTRTDPNIQFQWTLFSPDPEKIQYDFFSARWTGKLLAPATGDIKIGIDGNDGYRLYLDNRLLIDNWKKQGYGTKLKSFHFQKGRTYDIRVEYFEPSGNAWFRLIWDYAVHDSAELKIQEAVRLARGSDIAIIMAGIEEGEFRDRASLALPARQEEMIRRVTAAGKPVIVLLTGGSAITMSEWIDRADAVMMTWYAGENGGEAIQRALFGKVNPAGRLPITFPLSVGQLPLVYNHKPTGRGDDYSDLSGQPQFTFGFGLSYTQFQYSGLALSNSIIDSGSVLTLQFKLKNTGSLEGDEVVQLYLRDELASVARPVKELKAFQRVHLEAGEEKTVEMKITPSMLTMLDASMKETIEPGKFRVMIGSSSVDIRLREQFEVR